MSCPLHQHFFTFDEFVLGTDKSGKLGLKTHENHLSSMLEQFVNEKKLNQQSITEGEKLLNNHSKVRCKILELMYDIGEGQSKRCRDALLVKNNQVPVMLGLTKDHKAFVDPVRGPLLRPL